MNLMNLFCVQPGFEKKIAPMRGGVPFYAVFFLFLRRFLGSFRYIRYIGVDFCRFSSKTSMYDVRDVLGCRNVYIRFSPKTCPFTAFLNVFGCRCEVHPCTSER